MAEESPKPSAEIIDISDVPESFFEMLPDDWKFELTSNWDEFAPAVKVYGIKMNDELIGGGLVFSAFTSETDNYPQVAQYYFDNDFLYIGYLWVEERFRGKNLGDFWLKAIFEMYPNNPFWLSIEDLGLAKFYLKNGFTLEREMIYHGGKDWVYLRKSAAESI